MTDYVGQQFGHYRLIRLLGQGGFADVYLGEHIHLGSFAAVKILYARLVDEYHEHFLNEARTLERLSHQHIIRMLDFGIEEGIPFLIMEYAPHGTLRQRHSANTKLPLSTVVDYVNQIAAGLQYAHDQNLIHRDLKPSNVLIGQANNLLLSDFGVALMAQTTYSQRVESAVVGTITYVAPEQLQGKPQLASDQYSLGIMVYEWLCGHQPFHGTVSELWAQHQSAAPAPLRQYVPDLPAGVEMAVLAALAKDPGQRFASVRMFASALEAVSCVISSHNVQSTQVQAADKEGARAKVTTSVRTPQPAAIPEPDESVPSSRANSDTIADNAPAVEPVTTRAPGRYGQKKRVGAVIVAFVLLLIASTLAYAISSGSMTPAPVIHKNQPANENKIVEKGTLSPTVRHVVKATPTRRPTAHPTRRPTTHPIVPVVQPTAAPATSVPVATHVPSPPPATPTPVSPPVCPSTIESGSTGSLVKTLQRSLNTHYSAHDFSNSPYNFSPPLAVDGIFGSLTQSAVKDYQSANGLQVDGVVGPKTWHSLGYC
jgi:serine/threonine protein kinase